MLCIVIIQKRNPMPSQCYFVMHDRLILLSKSMFVVSNNTNFLIPSETSNVVLITLWRLSFCKLFFFFVRHILEEHIFVYTFLFRDAENSAFKDIFFVYFILKIFSKFSTDFYKRLKNRTQIPDERKNYSSTREPHPCC